MIKKILVITLLFSSFFFSLLYIGVVEAYSPKESDTSREREVIQIDNLPQKDVVVGYVTEYERVSMEPVFEMTTEKYGVNFVWNRYPSYIDVLKGAQNGTVDIVGSLTQMSKLDEQFIFSEPVYLNYTVGVTRISDPIESLDKLYGKKVGFVENDPHYEYAKVNLRNSEYTEVFYPNFKEMKQALNDGEIDMMITEKQWIPEIISDPTLTAEFKFQGNPTGESVATTKMTMLPVIRAVNECISLIGNTELDTKVEESQHQYLLTVIQAFFDTHYVGMGELPESITVLANKFYYPFIFEESDGRLNGTAIEVLELFKEVTGIDYVLESNVGNTTDDMLQQLNDDEVQFVIGEQMDTNYSNVISAPAFRMEDNIVGVTTVDIQESIPKNISEIQFGIVELSYLPENTDIRNLSRFSTYKEAYEALLRDKIDVIITRESVLDYYQAIRGKFSLTKYEYFKKNHYAEILGNTSNILLTSMMVDMESILQTVENTDWEMKEKDYQKDYLTAEQTEMKGRVVMIAFLSLVVIIILFYLLFKWGRTNRQLLRKRQLDQLTGIYNADSYKMKCLELVEKSPSTLGVFVFIDLNDFKYVNDTYGHGPGDKVLIAFADALRKFTAKDKQAIAFRVAGDEFGFMKVGFETEMEVHEYMEQFSLIHIPDVVAEGMSGYTIKFSTGYAIYGVDTSDMVELQHFADFSMYQAKRLKYANHEARNMAHFDREYYNEARNPQTDDLDTVIKENQLYTLFQSIYTFSDGEVYGQYALSRTTNIKFTTIKQVIENAHVSGEVVELDHLLIENSLKEFSGEGKLFIPIEISDKLLDTLYYIMKEANVYRIPYSNIIVDMGDFYCDDEELLEHINRLKRQYEFEIATTNKRSIEIADIFIVKQKYIERIEDDEEKQRWIQQLVETTDMQILCQGIESAEEKLLLKTLGVHLGQGYYLGLPHR